MRRRIVSDHLFAGRFRGPDAIRKLIESPRPQPKDLAKPPKKPPKYIKGVHNGNYFRIKIPLIEQRPIPTVVKLPPPNPTPLPFKSPPPRAVDESAGSALSKVLSSSTGGGGTGASGGSQKSDWLKANWSILLLNFGSICTLTGFTRSDVLELRCLSVTGSLCGIGYLLSHKQILWPSVCWSATFASVNAVKIYQILHERNAKVYLTDDQEEVYCDHFMPHGITPKQFERLERKSKYIRVEKGDVLIRTGEKLDHLYLIVQGSTQAHILGRSLTAASTTPETRTGQKEGGDSGAWVGEMAFLDQFWEKEQAKMKLQRRPSNGDGEGGEEAHALLPPRKRRSDALYTIRAAEDCLVMRWSFEDMEELMASSTDLRAAMTRAMTSALVGKVVNLTISRTNKGLPNWSAWLSDWKHSDGASVNVRNVLQLPEDLQLEADDQSEKKPKFDPGLVM
jgi:CRP-like cAMP-binding protein